MSRKIADKNAGFKRCLFSAVMLLVIALVGGSEGDTRPATGQSREQIEAYAKSIGTAAVLVLQSGEPVFEFGDLTREYMCHSIRKPFLGALIGIEVHRGTIRLDQTLADLGIDDIPPSLVASEKSATVRDLLHSRSGVYHTAAGEASSMIASRPPRNAHPPGEFFYYNNWDFNVLGTISMNLRNHDIQPISFGCLPATWHYSACST